MVAYSIKYQTKSEQKAYGNQATTRTISIDAKDLKSAKHKIETSLAKKENKNRPISKQIALCKIEILDYSVVGYY